jgi:hypothetical protein
MFWSIFTACLGLIQIYEAHDAGELIGYATVNLKASLPEHSGSHAGIQSYIVSTRHAVKWKTESSLLLTNDQECSQFTSPMNAMCHPQSAQQQQNQHLYVIPYEFHA